MPTILGGWGTAEKEQKLYICKKNYSDKCKFIVPNEPDEYVTSAFTKSFYIQIQLHCRVQYVPNWENSDSFNFFFFKAQNSSVINSFCNASYNVMLTLLTIENSWTWVSANMANSVEIIDEGISMKQWKAKCLFSLSIVCFVSPALQYNHVIFQYLHLSSKTNFMSALLAFFWDMILRAQHHFEFRMCYTSQITMQSINMRGIFMCYSEECNKIPWIQSTIF